MNQEQTLLKTCPLFHGMSDVETDAVLNLFETQNFPRGEIIIREGNSNQLLWILAEGQCEVLKLDDQQHQYRLAVLEPGGVFGEMSFFHAAPHSASIRTLGEARVMRLWRKKYDTLLESCPGAALKIAHNTAQVLAERLRKMDDWICTMMRQNEEVSRQRKAEWEDFRSKLQRDWGF